MSALDMLAEKMDQLPSKEDLRGVEYELTNKLQQTAMKFDKKIQENAREIRSISQRLDKQSETVARLELEIDKQRTGNSVLSVAEFKRREAQEEKYFRARRTFRIWPVTVRPDEQIKIGVRRFFSQYKV